MTDNETFLQSLLLQMTLEEKIGQLTQLSVSGKWDETLMEKVRKGQVGSLIMAQTALAGSENPAPVPREIYDALQAAATKESRLGIPLLCGRDIIHGHHTVLPIPLGMAASFDDALVTACYRDVATQAANDGVHWAFAPMLDCSADPRWGRCIESPGEDPYLGGRMGAAIVQGFQGDNLSREDTLAACAKHYIGYGASEGGRDYAPTEISEYTLRNRYLPAFKAAIQSGVRTVMNSFNTISGQPVTSSRYLLTQVLKEELGFDGFVVSDWGAIPQLINQGVAADRCQAAQMAFTAGVDMDMATRCYTDHLAELVESGAVDIAAVDEAVYRVLRVKMDLGLWEHPFMPRLSMDRAAQDTRARALAANSMVLLKNNGALPLSRDKTVAMIGPMVWETESLLGSWTLDGNPADVVLPVDALRRELGAERVLSTHSALPDEQLFLCRKADVVVLALGESHLVTGEAKSLADIHVPAEQVALAAGAKALGKPVVAVMHFGRPVVMTALEPYCDAILYAWHPGTQAGGALADILLGKVTPSGKLPMTMPRHVGQISLYYNAYPNSRVINEYYGETAIYGNYLDESGAPLYPFGFGLSYTTFAIENISLERNRISVEELRQGGHITVTVRIANRGECDGREVVQLYVRDPVASMSRPLRELRRYEGVYIPAGESRDVIFLLNFDTFAFYNGEREYVVEPGEFTLFIGSDCLAPACGIITVK